MVLALFATIWQLTRRSGETWIITYEIENREYNFPVSSVQTEEWCERESGEKEKKKAISFCSLLLRRPHYLNACYLMEQARSSSFSTTPKI